MKTEGLRILDDMALKYQPGEEIKKGDTVHYFNRPALVGFVAAELGDPETDWFVQEFGGGVMILDDVAGRTFIPADQIPVSDALEFVSRADS